jgi:hypothetical protein
MTLAEPNAWWCESWGSYMRSSAFAMIIWIAFASQNIGCTREHYPPLGQRDPTAKLAEALVRGEFEATEAYESRVAAFVSQEHTAIEPLFFGSDLKFDPNKEVFRAEPSRSVVGFESHTTKAPFSALEKGTKTYAQIRADNAELFQGVVIEYSVPAAKAQAIKDDFELAYGFKLRREPHSSVYADTRVTWEKPEPGSVLPFEGMATRHTVYSHFTSMRVQLRSGGGVVWQVTEAELLAAQAAKQEPSLRKVLASTAEVHLRSLRLGVASSLGKYVEKHAAELLAACIACGASNAVCAAEVAAIKRSGKPGRLICQAGIAQAQLVPATR